MHAWHWVVLWRALGRPGGVVVVRPFTSGWPRRAVLRRARRHHRAVHLLGGPYGTPYHAHVKTADGTLKVVLVNASFEATAVQADRGRQGRGPGDRDGRHVSKDFEVVDARERPARP